MPGQIDLYTLSKEKAAPVLYGYVCWVLEEAQKRGIRTLYFLARDGYVLREIAGLICEKQSIGIECRYLYCSRAALRMPTYHLIGEEAFDLLFAGGCHITLRSLLARTQIPEELWQAVFADAGIDRHVPLEERLSDQKLGAYKKQLAKSPLFKKQLYQLSKSAYEGITAYLMQEKVFEQKTFAMVDSGWIGSMQRSFRQLLNAAGWSGDIIGFYFGLFVSPPYTDDGTYLAWYFSGTSGKKNKIFFCNNLFECFLAAPHGMTVDYQIGRENVSPVLKESPMDEKKALIQQQMAGIINGAKKLADCGRHISKKSCQQILYQFMSRPSKAEVNIYSQFLFCDDITDGYFGPLADETQISHLKDTLLLARLFHKLFKIPADHDKLFWNFGTIAYIKNPIVRQLYWINECICQWCRYSLR